MSADDVKTQHRVCQLCEAMCGLVIKTTGESVIDIRGDKDDPLSRGHVCPKAVALQDIHEDPDRLRKPLKRVRSVAGQYHHVEIEWSEALDLAADAHKLVPVHAPRPVALCARPPPRLRAARPRRTCPARDQSAGRRAGAPPSIARFEQCAI